MTKPVYLHVEFPGRGWGLRLRAAIQRNANLAVIDSTWRQDVLADLAFSIDIRIEALQELAALADEALASLEKELRRRLPTGQMLKGDVAYTFHNGRGVIKAVSLLGAYATEAESLFDNLVDFYRRFLKKYGGQDISQADAETEVTATGGIEQWRVDLSKLKNLFVHRLAPWLAFEINSRGRRLYQPVLIHDWRPECLSPAGCTPLETLRRVRAAVSKAARNVESELCRVVDRFPGNGRVARTVVDSSD